MLDYSFFLSLAIILGATKLFGTITKRFRLPQVVGALVAGIIIGPACFNVVSETDFLLKLAEVGVVMLMFNAGLETDIKQIRKTGVSAILIATIGVIVPMAGGFLVNLAFFNGQEYGDILPSIFLGVVLTATSVSITVETLRELGKLKGKIGSAILAAAVIDDILGIIVLTVITGFTDKNVNPGEVFLRIVLFGVATVIVGGVMRFIFKRLEKRHQRVRRIPIYGLVFCFAFAYIAEQFFGIADIIGAYFIGIILSNFEQSEYIARRVDIASYMFFSPIFFASVGLSVSFSGMTWSILLFGVVLLIVAMVTKLIGCGGAALLCRFTIFESVAVGIGMISRGEVALIVAQKGLSTNLISQTIFPAIIFVVVLTTLVAPILLKVVFSKEKPEELGLSKGPMHN